MQVPFGEVPRSDFLKATLSEALPTMAVISNMAMVTIQAEEAQRMAGCSSLIETVEAFRQVFGSVEHECVALFEFHKQAEFVQT